MLTTSLFIPGIFKFLFLTITTRPYRPYYLSRFTTTGQANMSCDWEQLDPESLVSAPCLIEQTLCEASDARPKLAKNFDYAKAILDAWREEEDISWQAVWKPVVYQDTSGTDLHGYCIRRHAPSSEHDSTKLPGIIFFHTGAGPHDLFLIYKAVSLLNSLEDPSVVLIADILSDDSGWAWSPDRTRYNHARDLVLSVDERGSEALGPCRPILQQRIQAAVDYLVRDESVDRYAAFGWCLGGHPVLEACRMPKLRNLLRVMVSFHGVFDGLPVPETSKIESQISSINPVDVLICHGSFDPFVPDENLENALATLQAYRCRTSLLQLPAKHGFTNPAQDFNDAPGFAFDVDAATKAWRQAISLVKQKLL